MSALELALVFLAGAGAGFINAIVGAGTLITFSTLVTFGVPPVVANASNNVGLAPGSLSAALGFRSELAGQRQRVLSLASASLIGSIIGAVLLLALPSRAFDAIVPALILLGVVLVIAQKPLSRWVNRHHPDAVNRPTPGWVWPGVLACGIYGGYFGAAQGVLLMAIMGIGISESMQRLNAVKNVLATVANTVAGVIFVVLAPVDWRIAGLIAVGSVIGAQIGAKFGRRLPETVYRTFIVIVGLAALAVFLLR
jgi:uncharacterized membrane protein YfcA